MIGVSDAFLALHSDRRTDLVQIRKLERVARTGKTVAHCACAILISGNTSRYGRMRMAERKPQPLNDDLSRILNSRKP